MGSAKVEAEARITNTENRKPAITAFKAGAVSSASIKTLGSDPINPTESKDALVKLNLELRNTVKA